MTATTAKLPDADIPIIVDRAPGTEVATEHAPWMKPGTGAGARLARRGSERALARVKIAGFDRRSSNENYYWRRTTRT